MPAWFLILLTGPVGLLFLLYFTFLLFVMVMGFYRLELQGKLTKVLRWLAMPVLVVGYVCDFLVNIGPATLLFLDLPGEMLLTMRLKRYMTDDKVSSTKVSPFRKRIAEKICNVLNMFDPTGAHC